MVKGDSKFHEYLQDFSRETDPQKRKTIENLIWQEYGAEHTALVLDMSGFSLLTRKYGIVHYLSMIERMQQTVGPIINSHEGHLIKFEADNCFAVFPSPLMAVRAAITIHHAFAASNFLTADELDIHVSIGIDYGMILIVDNQDMFGDAVNRACKMGEDIGTAGKILITHHAMEMIPENAEIRGEPLQISIGGMEMQAYQIIYKPDELKG